MSGEKVCHLFLKKRLHIEFGNVIDTAIWRSRPDFYSCGLDEAASRIKITSYLQNNMQALKMRVESR